MQQLVWLEPNNHNKDGMLKAVTTTVSHAHVSLGTSGKKG